MSFDKLPNALIEMVVVTGLNESTEIIPPSIKGCDDPFSIALDPQILAALSCQVALFPSISTHADDSYPPQARRMPSSSDIANTACKPPTPSSNGKFQRSSHSRVQVKSAPSTSADDCRKPAAVKSCGNVDDAATGQFKRTMSVRRKLAPVDFAPSRQGQSTMLPMAQLPLSDETLGSLLTFCFPDKYFLYADAQSDQVHHLVLTNMLGTRTYATCFTHFARMFIFQNTDGSWRGTSQCPSRHKDLRLREAYVPCCYVVISKYPYFTTLKDCLSRLMSKLQQNGVDWHRSIKEFALQLSTTPVLCVQNIQLEFQLFGTIMTLPSVSAVGRRPVDFNLGLIFQFMDIQTILFVFTALILQQRIVFLSSSYALLTLITESFMHLLFPFRWQLTYVPVLPLDLLELVEAPGTFVMGCHLKHWQLLNTEVLILAVLVDYYDSKLTSLPEDRL